MKGFLITKKSKELEEISREINNLSLRESLKLSGAGYIGIQIRDNEGEEIRNLTGQGAFILGRFEKGIYVLEFKNEILDDPHSYYKDVFRTKGEWQFMKKTRPFIRGIGAPLEHQQEIFIYSL